MKMSSFFCSLCCRPFTRKENLEKHNQRLHSDIVSVYLCGYCEQTCSTFFNLKTHHSRFHKNRKFEENDVKIVKRLAQNKRCAVLLERLDLDLFVSTDRGNDTESEESAQNIEPVPAVSTHNVPQIKTKNCSVVLERLDPEAIGTSAVSESGEQVGHVDTDAAVNDLEAELAVMFGEDVDMTNQVNVEPYTKEPAASESLEGILSDPSLKPSEDVENVLPMQYIDVDSCIPVDQYRTEGFTNRDPLANEFRTNTIWVRRNFTKTISDVAAEEKESRKRQLVIYDPVISDDGQPKAKNGKTSEDIDEFLSMMRK